MSPNTLTETRYAFKIRYQARSRTRARSQARVRELIRWYPSLKEAVSDAAQLMEREYGGARLVSVVRDESYAPISFPAEPEDDEAFVRAANVSRERRMK